MTKRDICEAAFRSLGVVAHDTPMTADQFAFAGGVLDGLIDEVAELTGVVVSPDAPPSGVDRPLALLLAAEMAPSYDITSVDRGGPLLRVAAILRPDNRDPDAAAETEYF